MEGIIQYRLLGNHPAASGRYLTVGFPGETTTTDKILEQVVNEHRVNTSRYKLDVCRLVPARDAPASAPPPLPPPDSGDGTFAGSGTSAGGHNALVPVAIHGSDVLRTYDRLTITVSKRDIADDEAARKEKELLERQRRLKEMEEQLLSRPPTTSGAGVGGIHAGASASPQPRSRAATGARHASSGASPAVVDNQRLQRAAALASQLFPIMKGQRGTLTGLHDAANTHQCVLCRLPAFEEELTACCRFSVCRSCYASASEMVMEEGQCPVCGALSAAPPTAGGHASAVPLSSSGGGVSKSEDTPLAAHGKRTRDADVDSRGAWKREGGESKVPLQPAAAGSGVVAGGASAAASRHRDTAAGVPSSSAALSLDPASTASAALSEVVLQTEERLRSDLDQALSMLDAPDPLSAAAKAKRVVGAEVVALSR
ncbi:hypothetical protein NESM_000199300 [Novymonas esmeraldas]|uniref:RING-type domain-containing protein n=1 Tax=Novymonas esmeraldas TaxID=1808958 RepID=A0AAW0F5R9_9TRYP